MTVVSDSQRAEVDSQGVTRYVQSDPGFLAQWEVKTLSDADITAAKEQILMRGGRYAFGSIPGSDEGNINIQDAVDLGYSSTAHDSFDVYQRLSLFDTEDPAQCPPQYREMTEEFLCGHYELGLDYVRVDNYNLTPPWPTYPIEGDVDVKKLVEFAVTGGLVGPALAFEMASAKRQDLIEALTVIANADLARKQEDAALSATV
jgi:hypothetical protein